MAKDRISGWIHEPLAAVLGTRAKVAVLRVLWRATSPLPYREVVRRSGMAYRSIALALADLSATGLVEELEGGRERRVRLRTGHRLAASVSNLLQVDADFFGSLRVELRSVAAACEAEGLLAAAMVGRAARREEILGDGLDVVAIARDAASAVKCRDRFHAAAPGIGTRFGVRLTPIVYDLATARGMWRSRTETATRDVRESEWLAGRPLEELLSADESAMNLNTHSRETA